MKISSRVLYGILTILGLSLFFFPFLGIPLLSPEDIADPASPQYLVFWRWRVPRVIGAFFAGAGFSLAGLIFQALFRTPLATPYTLGVSSGAAFGAALYIRTAGVLQTFMQLGPALGAFAGCGVATLFVGLISSWRTRFETGRLLLAGISVNFLFSSIVMFIQYASNASDAVQIMRWLMGSLTGLDYSKIAALATIVIFAILYSMRRTTELDLMTAGEGFALSKGLDARNLRLEFFILTSVLVGSIVSITGPIGFVGMIVPQVCRMFCGPLHKYLMPASIVLGGWFLGICDIACRTFLYPAEIPVGILTAMLGAPFFLWIIFSLGKHSSL